MTKLRLIFGLVIISCCLVTAQKVSAHAETDPNKVVVHVEDKAFYPVEINLTTGQIIVLENVGKVDKWITLDGPPVEGFNLDKVLLPGETREVKFVEPGKWGIFDSVNPQYSVRIFVAEPLVVSAPQALPIIPGSPVVKVDGELLMNILRAPIELLPSEHNRTLFHRVLTAIAKTENQAVIMEMHDDGYTPTNLTIPVGTTIKFRNLSSEAKWPASDDHPTHQKYGESKQGLFDVGKPLPVGEEWDFNFTKTGEWGYHDHLFPSITGHINVTDEAGGQSQSVITTGYNLARQVINAVGSYSQAVQSIDYKTDYTPPTTAATYEQLLKEYEVKCEPGDFKCFTIAFRGVTEKYGPSVAMDYYSELRDNNTINPGLIDEHLLIHHIGRQTAETFGINNEGFLLCPQTYIYGCQHGYLEYAMARIPEIKDIAAITCGKMTLGKFTDLEVGGCYHGMGHAIMMANGNDIYKSLEICETLGDLVVAKSCAQGVFMENAALPDRGEARAGVFSDTDLLAPCNKVDAKYLYECYINHHGYLMYIHKLDLDKTIATCGTVEQGEGRQACFQGIGLLIGTEHWYRFLPHDPKADLPTNAWKLCQKIAYGDQLDCIYGVLANIQNYEILDARNTGRFCSLTPVGVLRNSCFMYIGQDLNRRKATNLQKLEQCTLSSSDKDYVNMCLNNAQFQPVSN